MAESCFVANQSKNHILGITQLANHTAVYYNAVFIVILRLQYDHIATIELGLQLYMQTLLKH